MHEASLAGAPDRPDEEKTAEATATSVRDRWREKGEHTVARMNE